MNYKVFTINILQLNIPDNETALFFLLKKYKYIMLGLQFVSYLILWKTCLFGVSGSVFVWTNQRKES